MLSPKSRQTLARFAKAADDGTLHQEVQKMAETYKIVRFCQDENDPEHRRVIDTGLTLEQAQAHCQREDTHGEGWFDGYNAE